MQAMRGAEPQFAKAFLWAWAWPPVSMLPETGPAELGQAISTSLCCCSPSALT